MKPLLALLLLSLAAMGWAEWADTRITLESRNASNDQNHDYLIPPKQEDGAGAGTIGGWNRLFDEKEPDAVWCEGVRSTGTEPLHIEFNEAEQFHLKNYERRMAEYGPSAGITASDSSDENGRSVPYKSTATVEGYIDAKPLTLEKPSAVWCEGSGPYEIVNPQEVLYGQPIQVKYEREICGMSDGSVRWQKKTKGD